MSKIIAIQTAVPAYKHRQQEILAFMQRVYAADAIESRKMKFLYHQGGISTRYSVVPDYSLNPREWKFYPKSENLEPFPSLEQRMAVYQKHAAPLSVDAIRNCLNGVLSPKELTHLITVSCTGMSAPGLDLQIVEMMDLPKHIYRTSVNFMGCYAAIHALKIADSICRADPGAKVMIVCTELCTLHFQKEQTVNNILASMLFADGAAATLVVGNNFSLRGVQLNHFYSEIIPSGKKDMAWELSSTGFQMTLSGYIPDLIEEDFDQLITHSVEAGQTSLQEINHWCIHPGGKRILEAVQKSLALSAHALHASYRVLDAYGNMSSPTILFVLKELLKEARQGEKILGAAFGPGLTMETFMAEVQ